MGLLCLWFYAQDNRHDNEQCHHGIDHHIAVNSNDKMLLANIIKRGPELSLQRKRYEKPERISQPQKPNQPDRSPRPMKF